MDLTISNLLVVRRRDASKAEAEFNELRGLGVERFDWCLQGWFMNIPNARQIRG